MSIRCKVCNATKIIDDDQTIQTNRWECKVCGNILDIAGNVIQSN